MWWPSNMIWWVRFNSDDGSPFPDEGAPQGASFPISLDNNQPLGWLSYDSDPESEPLILPHGVALTVYGCCAPVRDCGCLVDAAGSGKWATSRDKGCSYESNPKKVALILPQGVPLTVYGCCAPVRDCGCLVDAAGSGKWATSRDRGCSYESDPEKVALALPLGVLLTGCGYCGPSGDRGCNVSLPLIGKGGSHRGSGCNVILWLSKVAELWNLRLGLSANHIENWCGHNTILALELLGATLAHIISQGGVESRDVLIVHSIGLCSNMSNWDQDCEGKSYGSGNCGSDQDRGCKVALSRSSKFGLYQGSHLLMCPFIEPAVPPYVIYKDGGRHSNNRGCSMNLSRTGLCGSAPTRLTGTVFPKPELDVLPRKMVGCWALIVLCVLSLMTKPRCSRLFSIDFADYGTYISGLARLFDSSLPSWVDRKASMCGGFPWAGCKKYTSGRKLAIVVPPWCDKDPKGRLILSSRNHPKVGNNSPDQDMQQCLVVARSGNKGSNWERVGSLDLVTIGKCGKAQPKGCTVGHNRINSCSSIDVRGCSGNLAENGNCKPAHGNWLGSGLPTWEVITPFKGEEGCGAFIVKSLLPLLSGPQATREATYVNISAGKREISITLLLSLSFWFYYSSWVFEAKETLLLNQLPTCIVAFCVDCPTFMADPTNVLAKQMSVPAMEDPSKELAKQIEERLKIRTSS
ncbi:hypothetical protein V6N12_033256 [Hibiscus sabdariffa]|uniref:Uncharacterized protein n=1 Tax=Hibiscus sabdariffa TaxID=183260 RepID=A0ABR2BAA4_9ROSI